jgi:type II secretory pathway component HofQ
VEGALAELREAGNALNVPQLEAMLSDAHLVAGDADAALAHAEEALRTSAARRGWFDAELHRRSAATAAPGPATRPARRASSACLDIARSQSAPLFELRAARDLARLCATRGRVAEAAAARAGLRVLHRRLARPDPSKQRPFWMSWRPVVARWCRVSGSGRRPA